MTTKVTKTKPKKSPRYFDAPRGEIRPAVERLWIEAFLRAARFSVQGLVARKAGEDPPDCEATVDGASAGIEAVELIYEKTAASFDHRMCHFVWDQPSFLAHIYKIIATKDEKRWLGGPYDRRILVIYTNELYLPRDKVKLWLAGQRFGTALFSDVVLGFSYDPRHRKLRPALRLRLARPQSTV